MGRTERSRIAPVGTSRAKRLGILLGGLAAILACVAIRSGWGPTDAGAGQPGGKSSAPAQPPAGPGAAVDTAPNIVAIVNGEEISRNDLGKECMRHFGKDVIEAMVNRRLITEECQRQKIVISKQDVNDEVEQTAKRFRLPVDQMLKLLEQERGISPGTYAQDIVWTTLALKKIASGELKVSDAEIQAAFDNHYGEAVQARMIVCSSRKKAEEVRAMVAAKPDDFGRVAKDKSDDANTASSMGMIQPIRRHMGDATLEEAAFKLKPGEISGIVPVGEQFVILKCEALIPARKVPLEGELKERLADEVKDRKMQKVAEGVFKRLQMAAKVQNVYNDPEKSKQLPGVAATINGQPITIHELAEACIERHGVQVLESVISHRLMEQALRKQKLTVAQADLDQEVMHIALAMGRLDENHKPDAEGLIKQIQQEQGITRDQYLHDVIWPAVALKKLIGDSIKITDEDLQKGFEANYGERVRCRAIVFNNMRRGQEVWEMARRNPTPEYFGELAHQYSIEAQSRELYGQVPPVARHGSQPLLEKVAFELKKGELSGLTQIGPEQFVILLCDGRTEPVKVTMAEVHNELFTVLFEKKQRIAMGDYYEKLKNGAQIDNILAGSSQSPKSDANAKPVSSTDPKASPAAQSSRQPARSGVERATYVAPAH